MVTINRLRKKIKVNKSHRTSVRDTGNISYSPRTNVVKKATNIKQNNYSRLHVKQPVSKSSSLILSKISESCEFSRDKFILNLKEESKLVQSLFWAIYHVRKARLFFTKDYYTNSGLSDTFMMEREKFIRDMISVAKKEQSLLLDKMRSSRYIFLNELSKLRNQLDILT